MLKKMVNHGILECPLIVVYELEVFWGFPVAMFDCRRVQVSLKIRYWKYNVETNRCHPMSTCVDLFSLADQGIFQQHTNNRGCRLRKAGIWAIKLRSNQERWRSNHEKSMVFDSQVLLEFKRRGRSPVTKKEQDWVFTKKLWVIMLFFPWFFRNFLMEFIRIQFSHGSGHKNH